MISDIDNYVKTCDSCQRTNLSLKKTPATLHPVPVSSVWHRIGIDLIGPLKETPRGNKYIITCTDYHSKWAEALPLKTKEAGSVADFLYDLVIIHSCPSIIMSDQGREFINKVISNLCEKLHIDQRISSAYHPQTNGLDERFNQTLIRSLQKVVETEEEWDLCIKPVLFAYRTSKQASSKYTPFELLYGRKPCLPIELETAPTAQSEEEGFPSNEAFDDTVAKHIELCRNIRSAAKANIEVAQNKQKRIYDAKHVLPSFKIGDKVLLRNLRKTTRKGGKLDPNWTGPYEIAERLDKGCYKLKNTSGTVLKTSYNSSRLKLYYDPPSEGNIINQFHA